jgi:hypothetical protein
VKVVAMGFIEVGTQHNVEEAAGTGAQIAQKGSLAGALAPVLQDGDARSVRQPKPVTSTALAVACSLRRPSTRWLMLRQA